MCYCAYLQVWKPTMFFSSLPFSIYGNDFRCFSYLFKKYSPSSDICMDIIWKVWSWTTVGDVLSEYQTSYTLKISFMDFGKE